MTRPNTSGNLQLATGEAAGGADQRVEFDDGVVGSLRLDEVPQRRVVELARWGMAGKAPALRRHPYSRKLATLAATVVYLEAKGPLMVGHMVWRVDEGRLQLTTFLHYERARTAAAVWAVVEHLHRASPRLIGSAATRVPGSG